MAASPRPRRAAPVTAALALVATGLAACGSDGSGPRGADEPRPTVARTSPTATGADTPVYTALGDSYTAGPYIPDTPENSVCTRSDGNYPSLIAARLPGFQLRDASCSGARVVSMVEPQTSDGGANPPQFDSLDPSVRLVTLGLGANEYAFFTTMLRTCLKLAPFADSPGDTPCRDELVADGVDQLHEKLEQALPRLAAVIEAIRDRAPRAAIYVVDYPQLVPATGTCDELPLAPGDYPFVRSHLLALSQMVLAAVDLADVGAVPVDLVKPSAGHDVCSDDPWIQGRETVAGVAAAYHPLVAEQEAVAELVLEQVAQHPAAVGTQISP